jgi:hypothetical protein
MKKPSKKSSASLATRLSLVTLALASMAPLPAALAPFNGISLASAQSNPCAPMQHKAATNPCAPKKAATSNPCAPMKASASNPCAPKAAPAKPHPVKGAKKCPTSSNPCAPAPKCTEGSEG